MRLKERFKNYRMPAAPAKVVSLATVCSSASELMKERRKQSFQWDTLPQVQDGEDEWLYERHVKSLKVEWSKRNPNSVFVEQLMNLTYPQ